MDKPSCTSANVRGRAYRCLHCKRNGKEDMINSKQRIEDHVYKYHIPNDMQPFWCRLCLFRCRTKESLYSHIDTYAKHKYVMKEKGIKLSRPFLVCSLNPHVVDESDIEMLTKEESMAWWTKKRIPSNDIIERAATEAHLDMDEGEMKGEEPLVAEEYDNEVMQAALDLRVMVEKEKKELVGVEEKEEKVVLDKCEEVEEPIDLRVVKVREMVVDENVSQENVKSGAEGNSATEKVEVGQKKKEETGNRSHKRPMGSEGMMTKRARHSSKDTRESEPSSSSSSSETDTDSDSETECKVKGLAEERERKFTDILGEMVRKTGEIVGAQVLENAKLINKLQTSVDLLRQEVAALRDGRHRSENSKQPERRREAKENRESGDRNVEAGRRAWWKNHRPNSESHRPNSNRPGKREWKQERWTKY